MKGFFVGLRRWACQSTNLHLPALDHSCWCVWQLAPRAPVAGSGLKLCLARTFGMSSSGLSVSTSSQRSLELDDKSDGLAVSENSRHGLLVRRAVVAVGGRVQEWAGINRGRGARGGNVLVVLAALAQPAPMPRKGHGHWSGHQPLEVTQTSWGPAPPRWSPLLVSLSARGAQRRSQAACPRLGSKEACPLVREGACLTASEEACPSLSWSLKAATCLP